MVECLVEFEYIAAEEDELTIKPGDVLSNVVKSEGGWWEGELAGKKGMFPDNFVKEIIKKPAGETNNRASVKKVPSGAGSHVADLASKLGKEGAIRIGPPSPNPLAALRRDPAQVNKRNLRVKATFSYSPENEDELALDIGDVLEVTKQEEEGWWEGLLNGKQGMFPSNFVEAFEDEGDNKSQGDASGDEVSTPDADFKAIQGKKIKGVGLGNIFSAGPIKLRSTQVNNSNHSTAKRESEVNNKPTKHESEEKRDSLKRGPPPPVPKSLPTMPAKDSLSAKPLERAKVLFSYSAENEDELSIEEGDILIILDKELEDNGWWKGEINGKVGVFPDNFVELLPTEEVQKPKKPPPPSTTPSKLKAEKSEPSTPSKIEPGRSVPVLPGKKSVIPPPVGKKPSKHADPRLMAQTDDHKVKESQKELNHLDSVESTEKLNHPTANRAKAPMRRLPSSIHTKEHSSPPPPQPKKREDMENKVPNKPSSHPKVMRPPPPTPTKEERPISSPPPPSEGAVSGNIEELRKEMDHLKANTVSRSKYEELQSETQQLKESVAQLKSSFNKKLLDLMNEIDEEKKIRLNMQVEIDRVKKLALS